ncbi:MAG: response regulator transcription factor [Actinomycetota bacterium]|nr:response regulator transcription factor [Actinomycetota bacterium]
MIGQPRPSSPILVVDDDAATCAGLVEQLERDGYSVTCAASGEEALELATAQPPALVVLEVRLPGLSGYEVCRRLRASFGDALPIVFVSAERTESYDRVAGLLVGADDYLVKPFSPDELLIRMERLLRRVTPVAPPVAAKLTPRELQILGLLAEGLSAAEIAARLVISPKTVSTHIDRILGKLGVRSRAQAVALAYRRELVSAVA